MNSAMRFSMYPEMNDLKWQCFDSTFIPSVLEPRQLHVTDQKQPGGLTWVV